MNTPSPQSNKANKKTSAAFFLIKPGKLKRVLTEALVILLISVMIVNMASCAGKASANLLKNGEVTHSADQSSHQTVLSLQSESNRAVQALEFALPDDSDLSSELGLNRSFGLTNPLEAAVDLTVGTAGLVLNPAPAQTRPSSTMSTPDPTIRSTTGSTSATGTTVAPTTAPTAKAIKPDAYFPVHNYGTLFPSEYATTAGVIANDDRSVLISTGSASDGVVLVNVNVAPDGKLWKAILKGPGGSYTYELQNRKTYMGLPLQVGNGAYALSVYEQTTGTSYEIRLTHTFNVTLKSSLSPFTASSIMVAFSARSACTSLAASLASGKSSQVARIEAIYNWIVQNIQYDRVLASSISSGTTKTYIPNPDATLKSRKGICYDYAALMAAMLRSQGIPTRLILGQVPQGYHAWTEVYLDGSGWIQLDGQNYRLVDGSSWTLFDPTLATSGLSAVSILNLTHNREKIY